MTLSPDPSAYWDGLASSAEFTHPLNAERFVQRVPSGSRILDYGCGQGRLCAQLSQLGYRNVIGVDSSEEMIRAARLCYPNLEFGVTNGGTLPDPAASFDVVLLIVIAVLTCIGSDGSQRGLIAELSRVLRPGGILLISDYALQEGERNLKRYAANADLECFGAFRLSDGYVMRHHSRDWLSKLLRHYRIEETVELEERTMRGNPARIIQLWAHRLERCSTPGTRG